MTTAPIVEFAVIAPRRLSPKDTFDALQFVWETTLQKPELFYPFNRRQVDYALQSLPIAHKTSALMAGTPEMALYFGRRHPYIVEKSYAVGYGPEAEQQERMPVDVVMQRTKQKIKREKRGFNGKNLTGALIWTEQMVMTAGDASPGAFPSEDAVFYITTEEYIGVRPDSPRKIPYDLRQGRKFLCSPIDTILHERVPSDAEIPTWLGGADGSYVLLRREGQKERAYYRPKEFFHDLPALP